MPLRNLFAPLAVKRAFRKPAPQRIRYARGTDCYVIELKAFDGDTSILLDAIDGETLQGRIWVNERYEDPIAIKFDELGEYELNISRFYGNHRIVYNGTLKFFFGEFTFLHRRVALRYWLGQFLFNINTRFRRDRMEVLSRLVSKELERARNARSPILHRIEPRSIIQLFSDMYGPRVFAHPAYERESASFRLTIESLVETGEIEKTEMHTFRLSPAALATIADFELTERRHRESATLNRRLVFLTLVIAAAAIVQAFSVFRGT